MKPIPRKTHPLLTGLVIMFASGGQGLALAEDQCGPQIKKIPAHKLDLARSDDKLFNPDYRLEGSYGQLVSWIPVPEKMIVTDRGYILIYPRDQMGNPQSEPTVKRVEGLIPKQILGDGRIVWETSKNTLLLTDKEGNSVRPIDSAFSGATFFRGILGEVSAEHHFAALKGDTILIADSSLKVIRKNRMDRAREVVASGDGWFAAYSKEANNVIVYGMEGQKISSFVVPHLGTERIAIAGRGGAIMVILDNNARTFDHSSGVETASIELPLLVNEYTRMPRLAFPRPIYEDHYYYRNELMQKSDPVEITVTPSGSVSRFVDVPCTALSTEQGEPSEDGGLSSASRKSGAPGATGGK